ncbi:PREDICTED: cell death protein hid [Drosophila arizonae]|uniref:Cell death protein hid n=1 Tax=Drosophila arizonae TaxID=7263 RepID=A0ABM1PA06_DROAR|nr:PREDICTED: cell death protein hid [Drosophila arizonae]
MAVPFHLPVEERDDIASSSSGTSNSSGASTSSGASSSSGASDGASSIASQSPNTTSSATQTPMQSPLPTDQVLIALCEWYQQHQRHYINSANATAPHIFQYPPPPSPSCSMAQSPSYTGGDIFFAHGVYVPPPPQHHQQHHQQQHQQQQQAPRTPHTNLSFAGGEELSFFRQPYPAPTTPQPMPQQPQPTPQSAPPVHYSHSYPQVSHMLQHHPAASYGHPLPAGAYYATYTPPPTPNTANASTSTGAAGATAVPFSRYGVHGPIMASTPLAPGGPKMRLQRSQSDAARRKRLTSTGEDEREYQSDHETSWDEFDDRYDNFTAGRERLQEFCGRIPPRKKKTNSSSGNNNANPCSSSSNGSSSSSNSSANESNYSQQPDKEKEQQSFTWPTVVTVFVLAMGWGLYAAR